MDSSARFAPHIDRAKCEGEAECLRVCPFDVFEVRELSTEERRGLGWLWRLRVALHGGKQAFVVLPSECYACGDCVQVCPEKAIRLEPVV